MTVSSRLKGAFPEALSYIAGYAGSGKSTILPFLLEEVGYDPHRVAFMAPTGKAAKVMRKKLAAQNFPNRIATTIHSAIYRTRPAPVQQLEQELYEHQESLQEYLAVDGGSKDDDRARRLIRAINNLQADLERLYIEDKFHFQLNVDSAIANAQVIVVDEASMVGEEMTQDLMSFGVPIIAMGDPGQLPPIGDKPGLTANRPDFFLSEVHRQAADNPIIHLATLARKGDDIPYGEYKDPSGEVKARVLRRRDYDPEPLIEQWRDAINDGDMEANLPQVIVGTNRTRFRITQMFRQGMPKGPTQYEPLIVRKNSREHPGLVNGALARCLSETVPLVDKEVTCKMSFQDEDGTTYNDMAVYQGLFEEHFSGKKNGITADQRSAWRAKQRSIHLDFAYALTVHNFQGSQADHVVLIDESSVFRDEADKHLYTGITRAAETLTILI